MFSCMKVRFFICMIVKGTAKIMIERGKESRCRQFLRRIWYGTEVRMRKKGILAGIAAGAVLLAAALLAGGYLLNSRREEGTEADSKQAVLELAEAEKTFSVGNRETLTRLTVLWEGEKTFEIAKEPSENQADFKEWYVTAPYRERQLVNVSELYQVLEQYTDWGYIEEADEACFADAGVRVEEEFSDTGKAVIRVGKQDGDGNWYVRADASKRVYRVEEERLKALIGVMPFDFMMGIPNLVYLTTVREFQADTRKTRRLFEVETDGDNAQIYRTQGKEVEAKKFTALYQKTLSILISGEADLQKAAAAMEGAEPVLVLRYKRNQEELEDVEISYYGYDGKSYLICKNGTAEFLAGREAVDQAILELDGFRP